MFALDNAVVSRNGKDRTIGVLSIIGKNGPMGPSPPIRSKAM